LHMRTRLALCAQLLLLAACQATAVPTASGATTAPAVEPSAAQSSGPSESPSSSRAPQSLGIAVFGDSIAAGSNVAEPDRWQTRLQLALQARDPGGHYTVLNFAQAGSRIAFTEQQVASFDSNPYGLAILIIGRDDAGFVFPDPSLITRYRASVSGVIRHLQAKGLRVIVANPPPELVNGTVVTTPVADFIRKLAGEGVVDLEKAFGQHADPASLFADQFQPNAAGEALIADTLLATIVGGGYLH
jgi:lysophospholipase L1-like esterase